MVNLINNVPLWTATPFMFLIMSIAIIPYVFRNIWSKFEAYFLFVPALSTLAVLYFLSSVEVVIKDVLEVLINDYLPFIILISCLYIISMGISFRLSLKPTPLVNTVFLFLAGLLASLMGTISASMVFLPTLLSMNKERKTKKHSVIFFIFMVANVGGCLTSVGDPPLFLGYLKGIDFFWATKNLATPVLGTMLLISSIYYVIDNYFFRMENLRAPNPLLRPSSLIRVKGLINILLLISVITIIASTGLMNSKGGDNQALSLFGCKVTYTYVLKNLAVLFLTLISWLITKKSIKEKSEFSWDPVKEVTKLFLAIFITMMPIHTILKEGVGGDFSPVFNFIEKANYQGFSYFWITGVFSSFLDNVPSYLLFFEMAGGEAEVLMNKKRDILTAISMSSVFMGALTYIGNAPNIMIKHLAEKENIVMPSFFAYLAISFTILIPIFLLISLVFLT